MLEQNIDISIRKQAELLNLGRATYYYQKIVNDDSEVANLISEIYLESDCRYGYRKISKKLQDVMPTNHKKVLRIMQEMGIQGLYPKRSARTTISAAEHKKFPYLLSSLKIAHPDHVWVSDITYIKIADKFVYLVAVIDLYSRYILGWELSHSLEAEFCIALVTKLLHVSKPEIFNSDQGVQYSSKDFTQILQDNEVKISMGHLGRCFDNIFMERFWRTLKQEAIYWNRPETLAQLELMLTDFVPWYNNQRLHQALKYNTPKAVYFGRT